MERDSFGGPAPVPPNQPTELSAYDWIAIGVVVGLFVSALLRFLGVI